MDDSIFPINTPELEPLEYGNNIYKLVYFDSRWCFFDNGFLISVPTEPDIKTTGISLEQDREPWEPDHHY